jgi:rod shape-determining protein MreC
VFLPKRKLIAFLFLFTVVVFIFFLSSQQAPYSFRSFFLDASKIPLLAVNFLSHEVRAVFFFHRSYWQNMELRRQNEGFRMQFSKDSEVLAENDRLRKLLELKKRISYGTTAASVIGKDFNSFRSYLILDKGRASALKKYAPVMTPLGLVGKVFELGRYSSKVILINDPDLSVPAMIERTREQGLVSGTLDGACKLRFLDSDSDIQIGDQVVTSGLNKTYPQGIVIGRVRWVGVESSGLGKFAILEPAVRISSLEEVLVVRNE